MRISSGRLKISPFGCHSDYVGYIRSGGLENQDWADNYDIWYVWFDRQGLMNGGIYNPVADHSATRTM